MLYHIWNFLWFRPVDYSVIDYSVAAVGVHRVENLHGVDGDVAEGLGDGGGFADETDGDDDGGGDCESDVDFVAGSVEPEDVMSIPKKQAFQCTSIPKNYPTMPHLGIRSLMQLTLSAKSIQILNTILYLKV